MIRWLIMGIVRDRTRFLFPWLVTTVGVMLMITLLGFIEGIFMSMVDMTAKLDTGHLRLVNKPFYEEEHLNPLDRALASEKETKTWLTQNSDPEIQWTSRIRWAALMDVPNERGETRSQTPVTGMGLDLLSESGSEIKRLGLESSLIKGRLPRRSHEMLAGYLLAESLGLEIDGKVTLLGQSFDGGFAADNYQVVGFVKFGVAAMDKKMALIDIEDAQTTFYMEDMVTDWLGFLPSRISIFDYDKIRNDLQAKLTKWRQAPPGDWVEDDFPILLSVLDQRNMGQISQTFLMVRKVLVAIFTFIMSLVLWNAGLLNGIHRYGEIGLRLALGETHGQLLRSLMIESLAIATLGCLAGSLLGGGFVYYLQEVGVNMGDAFVQTGMMFSDVMRGRLSLVGFLYGIVPGLAASVLGTLAAGVAIYQRSTAELFRELEA